MRIPKLGIDLSKKTFDVALVRDPNARHHHQHQFLNTPPGCQSLPAWLTKQGAPHVHAVVEATGAYGDARALFLTQVGQVVRIVNPAQRKAFGRSKWQRNKTDRAEAVLIARFAWEHHPAPWTPPTLAPQELQACVAPSRRFAGAPHASHQPAHRRALDACRARLLGTGRRAPQCTNRAAQPTN